MRPISEWDQTDLQALIDDDVRESLTLDYKRLGALVKTNDGRNELSKDVSAFANSAGGRIVYGIVEKGNKPVALDRESPPVEVSREWIEQTINSNVQPRIQGLIIKEIEAGDRSFFVIEIPQARNIGPHQAIDNKYYKRFNFQSVPMADYEIRDVMRRSDAPDLDLKLTIKKVSESSDRETYTMAIHAVIRNSSPVPANFCAISYGFDPSISLNITGGFVNNGIMTWPSVDENIEFNRLSRLIMVPHHPPLYKEEDLPIDMVTFTTSLKKSLFMYRISGPGFSKSALFQALWDYGQPKLIPLTKGLDGLGAAVAGC